MPASFPLLLQSLSEKAVQNLSYETIEPMYLAFSRVTSRDLNFVADTTLVRLQDSLIVVLKTSDVEEISTSLLSLAMLAKIASWQGAYRTSKDSITASDGENMTDIDALTPACRFFSTMKASKTLDLVAMKAILLCSRSCVLKSTLISARLRICAEIVEAVQSSERSSWIIKNSAMSKKLCEKILRPDLEREVQDAVSSTADTTWPAMI